jgi:hypothetical protein
VSDREPLTRTGRVQQRRRGPDAVGTSTPELRDARSTGLSTVRARTGARMSLRWWGSGWTQPPTSAPVRPNAKSGTSRRTGKCVLTTGCNQLDGLHLVVEGDTTREDDGSRTPNCCRRLRVQVRRALHRARGTLVRPWRRHPRRHRSGLPGRSHDGFRLRQRHVVQPDTVRCYRAPNHD